MPFGTPRTAGRWVQRREQAAPEKKTHCHPDLLLRLLVLLLWELVLLRQEVLLLLLLLPTPSSAAAQPARVLAASAAALMLVAGVAGVSLEVAAAARRWQLWRRPGARVAL